ncbi:hypothetical protein E2C01_078905 [Portunus trituberculatus]|uniref:Uncharacterized protein n=1 Tax=Portunus trituberculatus TaxID=210409 RepID=A0A5B7IRG2_PORTR|nr:hypothetical protein [Portunus trituberculatus]
MRAPREHHHCLGLRKGCGELDVTRLVALRLPLPLQRPYVTHYGRNSPLLSLTASRYPHKGHTQVSLWDVPLTPDGRELTPVRVLPGHGGEGGREGERGKRSTRSRLPPLKKKSPIRPAVVQSHINFRISEFMDNGDSKLNSMKQRSATVVRHRGSGTFVAIAGWGEARTLHREFSLALRDPRPTTDCGEIGEWKARRGEAK